jgi:hypothetical protein
MSATTHAQVGSLVELDGVLRVAEQHGGPDKTRSVRFESVRVASDGAQKMQSAKQ